LTTLQKITNLKIKQMKTLIKCVFAATALLFITATAAAQYKMDSNGKTISNSSNKTVGKIDSDGRTVSDANNSTLGKVDSDGKTISNRNNSTVLKISGNDIYNTSNSKVGTMSDVTSSISGAKPEAIYVALWWFIVKGNR
jgi:hypothetical protein